MDLNKGAHGDYLYAAFTRDSHYGELRPIIALDVVLSDTRFPRVDPSWIVLNQYDLNRGAKGKYVYIAFKKPPSSKRTIAIGLP